MSESNEHRDKQTIKLLCHLFQQMVKEEKTSPLDAVNYLPEYLLTWISKKLNLGELEKEEVLKEAQVDDIGWEFMLELVDSPVGTLQIAPVWPHIALGSRPAPKHRVKMLQAVYMITWEDNRIFPLSVHMPVEVLEEGCITDALAAAQLSQQFKKFQEVIFKYGLDVLHDLEAKDFGGDYPYEVLMGSFLKIIPQLKPELHEHLHRLFRLIQAVVKPPLSPEVQQMIAARRLKKQEKLVGGFDS